MSFFKWYMRLTLAFWAGILEEISRLSAAGAINLDHLWWDMELGK